MSSNVSRTAGDKTEVAFYYPNTFWYSGDWVKNLILFFDGVALLVPEYMKDRLDRWDPSIVSGLREHDLLHVLDPETLVDKGATEKLAEALVDLIASGALDGLTGDRTTAFAELSYSRLGGYGDPGLADMVIEELKRRGLARDTEDGVSIPMHPAVRSLVLVLLAQILRPQGASLGLDLQPGTDRPDIVAALNELLSLPELPSSGNVVSFDLMTVGVDLAPMPMEEILDFRRQHSEEYRAYARNIKAFVRELSLMGQEQRAEAFADRQEELDDIASDLRRTSRQAWKRPASFGLTLSGAAWTLVSGDPVAAGLSFVGGLVGGAIGTGNEAGVYSFLFRASRLA